MNSSLNRVTTQLKNGWLVSLLCELENQALCSGTDRLRKLEQFLHPLLLPRVAKMLQAEQKVETEQAKKWQTVLWTPVALVEAKCRQDKARLALLTLFEGSTIQGVTGFFQLDSQTRICIDALKRTFKELLKWEFWHPVAFSPYFWVSCCLPTTISPPNSSQNSMEEVYGRSLQLSIALLLIGKTLESPAGKSEVQNWLQSTFATAQIDSNGTILPVDGLEAKYNLVMDELPWVKEVWISQNQPDNLDKLGGLTIRRFSNLKEVVSAVLERFGLDRSKLVSANPSLKTVCSTIELLASLKDYERLNVLTDAAWRSLSYLNSLLPSEQLGRILVVIQRKAEHSAQFDLTKRIYQYAIEETSLARKLSSDTRAELINVNCVRLNARFEQHEAVKLLKQVLAEQGLSDYRRGTIYGTLSQSYFGLMEFDKAYETAMQAIKHVGPESPEATQDYNYATAACAALGRKNETLKLAQQAYKLAVSKIDLTFAVTWKIWALYLLGEYEQAIELWQKENHIWNSAQPWLKARAQKFAALATLRLNPDSTNLLLESVATLIDTCGYQLRTELHSILQSNLPLSFDQFAEPTSKVQTGNHIFLSIAGAGLLDAGSFLWQINQNLAKRMLHFGFELILKDCAARSIHSMRKAVESVRNNIVETIPDKTQLTQLIYRITY